MNNIATRTVWGGLFVAIIIASLFIGAHVTTLVLGAFMTLGLHEFYMFFKNTRNMKPDLIMGMVGGVSLFAIIALHLLGYLPGTDLYLFLIPFTFVPLLTFVFSRSQNALIDLALNYISWIYVVLTFAILLAVYMYPVEANYQWENLLGLFIIVWANDTFAFLSGLAFGKNKLFERISPKKTWEGAIGGFICTILFGLLYAFIVGGDYTFWVLAAIFVSPTSVFGDLIESKLKRTVNVKDSGSLIPGHGGVLDRFDAVMYAAPFFYFFILLYYK